jgi:formylglycine-generating enzyme required for sulfatase activity
MRQHSCRLAFIIRSGATLAATLVFLTLSLKQCAAASMEWVTVGDPNNVADGTGFGAVARAYRIGKGEVTNAQYADFLNHVAAADPYALYDERMSSFGIQRTTTASGYEYSVTEDEEVNWASKPVNLVSWYDAVRFANWVNNGKGSGDTESGAYTLLGGAPTPLNPSAIARNPDANVWLPSIDEWYKAAYYDPQKPGGAGYWSFPTGADDAPANELLPQDPGNSANFTGADLIPTLTGAVKLTDVGQFSNSASPFGTFDQAGNVAEWAETLVPGLGMLRAQLGGSWGSLAVGLQASNTKFAFNGAAVNSDRGGFRIASVVPEPSSAILAVIGLASTCVATSRRMTIRPRPLGE